MTPVAIALGSNLGDRERNLRRAADHLAAAVANLRLSSFHETAPVGVGEQPMFLNAAAVGDTDLPAAALLSTLLDIESRLGRERPYPGAPRTVDLDLIFYGREMVDSPSLVVPHPRFRERRFVLAPLAEVAPDWVDPATGLTVRALLAGVDRAPASPA